VVGGIATLDNGHKTKKQDIQVSNETAGLKLWRKTTSKVGKRSLKNNAQPNRNIGKQRLFFDRIFNPSKINISKVL
jgi:hypothetical protein